MKLFRAWRLRRAKLARADVVHDRKEWGWSYKPEPFEEVAVTEGSGQGA